MVPIQSLSATNSGMSPHGVVVEIGLLLPANRVKALVELSKQRQESVAQILRGLIDRALTDAEGIEC